MSTVPPIQLYPPARSSRTPGPPEPAPVAQVELTIDSHAVSVAAGEALLAFGDAVVAGVDATTVTMNLSARGDLNEAAANLFGYLRALDSQRARAIAVMPVPHHGLGEAINDRLRRAAIGRE